MLGVLILAMTILPIFNFLSSTTGGSKQEKTQAAAAAYAAKLMNLFLYELKWTNLTSENMSGQGFLNDDQKTGVEFQWTGRIIDAWPVSQEFAVKRLKNHSPCGGACNGPAEILPRRTPITISPDYCARPSVANMILKTIELTIKWRAKGDNSWDDARTMKIVARRGMLE